MDIQQFLDRTTILFALGIAFAIWVVKLIVEHIWPKLKKSKVKDTKGIHVVYASKVAEWWNEVILPVTPVILGGVIAGFAEKTFWPAYANTRLGGVFFGMIVGGFASFFYKVARKAFISATGVDPGPGPADDDTPDVAVEVTTATSATKVTVTTDKPEEKPVTDKPAEELAPKT